MHFFNLKAPDTILSRKLDFEKDEKMHRITEDMCQEMYANGWCDCHSFYKIIPELFNNQVMM